ncbi:MAG TPA: lipoprotein [Steroidobacteraceae bacterium]|nr:lipoprotein [Steroidobacteraceae bacterium]
MRSASALLMLVVLAGCGQTGKLYLPEAASDVVTTPAETPPASDRTEAPNSPQTPDSQPPAPAPAPEVSAPEEDPKKDKGAASPPPR